MCGHIDTGELQQSQTVTARKPHDCYACDETIAPGDRYVRTTQIADKSAETFKHCLRCWTMLDALWYRTGEAVQWDLNCGEIWEDPPPEVAALAFMTKGEIQALRMAQEAGSVRSLLAEKP